MKNLKLNQIINNLGDLLMSGKIRTAINQKNQ